jgi:pyrroline-5-carboxylate reductase
MGDGGEQPRTLVLVGCGKMGTAMLRGWIAAGAASRFWVVEPAGMPSGLAAQGETTCCPSAEALPPDLAPDAVVFAVKPQIVDEVLPDYRRLARPGALFLSIVAGKTLAGLARRLGPAAIVRTMPNTPAAIGRGITVAVAAQNVSAAQRAIADALLRAVGSVEWVQDEGLMDAVTAVSGSGPAYLFLLAEELARAGVAAGLPEALATKLARETVAGSGALLHRSDLSSAMLRQNVTSPGGTTAAALEVLMGKDGLQPLMTRAIAAATARSKELAK